jgi:transcriptional regulator with XRE-family HTH domain
MADFSGDNLRRLMAAHGWTTDQVAAETGLDRRTIKAILDGRHKSHPRTIKRLADGLGVTVDEFFVEPSQLLYRQFDRRTNPAVDELLASRPGLFADWTSADFEELHSRVGTGGPLTVEGVQEAVRRMNLHREIHEKLAVLLESSQADVVRGIVDLLYAQVVVKRG